jgi:hypothetical protein
MSNYSYHNIPCPKCKKLIKIQVWSVIDEDTNNGAFQIINGFINIAHCKFCFNKFPIKTSLLYLNRPKNIAIYYEPFNVNDLENSITKIKFIMGDNFYLSNASVKTEWKSFIKEIRVKESITLAKTRTIYTVTRRNPRTEPLIPYHWTCDVCNTGFV